MSQVKISGNASGTGVLTIAAPNTNTDRSITIPDKAGAIAVGAGTIVQVVQSVYGTRTAVTSTTLTDIGLGASITPTSSSNKILMWVSIPIEFSGSGVHGLDIHLYRGGSSIVMFADDDYYQISVNQRFTYNYHYMDSPATTSSTTYEIYVREIFSGRTSNFNSHTTGNNNSSIMTLMEVVA